MPERVSVGGLTVAFERAGDGSPLVLLHGGLGDRRQYRRQLDGLSGSFTVVAWDAPGCGDSSDPPGSFRMPEYADVLGAFIDELALDAPAVLGESWGSALALELYRRRPGLPSALVLVGAYAGWAGSLSDEELAERVEGTLALLEAPPEEVARRFTPTLLSDDASPELIAEVNELVTAFRPQGQRPMLRAMAEADLRDVLPTITVPTLLLFGEADARSSGPVAQELRRNIPGSELVILPGAGHACNLEVPDAFNAEVLRFLRSSVETAQPPSGHSMPSQGS